LPASDEARKMTVTSGQKYLPLCKQSGRVGAFSRMFLDTSTWASTKCYLTWKAKVTPSNRLLFQLAPSMPRTGETGSGSLLHTPTATANQMTPSMRNRDAGSWANPRQMIPTPTASDHIERNSTSTEAVNPLTGKSVSLDRFVKFWPDEETQQSGQPRMWPTPDTRGFCNKGSMELLAKNAKNKKEFDGMAYRGGNKEKFYPTPTARDYKDNGHSPAELARNSVTLATHAGGALNPAWVEWLMGYPPGWTNLETSQE